MTVNRNDVATTGTRLGKISKVMIRQLRSPTIRAESMKSRLRMESVCARSCRAPNAQPVTLMMTPITMSFGLAPLPRNPKMTMSSGSAGSTRKMLASMESRSSAHPPKYPAVTPNSTASTVAAAPATSETMIVLRPPASSWERTSCCTCVVPSQCAAEGGIGVPLVVETLVFGLYGATSGPMMARITNAPDRQIPVTIFGDRSNRDISGLLAGARVEERVDEIGGQVRQQDRERDDQEDPLQQRVVVAADGGEQQVTDPWVGEDDLGEQRS